MSDEVFDVPKKIACAELLDRVTKDNPRDVLVIWRSANGEWKRGRYTTEGVTAQELIGQLECLKLHLYHISGPVCEDYQ